MLSFPEVIDQDSGDVLVCCPTCGAELVRIGREVWAVILEKTDIGYLLDPTLSVEKGR